MYSVIYLGGEQNYNLFWYIYILTKKNKLIMDWYLKVLKQYADFDGRARRKEYWMFALFHMIVFIVLLMIFAGIGAAIDIPSIAFVAYIYVLATIIPNIAVTVRRLHDVGKSGWFILIGLIPFASILLLIWSCQDGEAGTNEYGPNPKKTNNELEDIGVEQV